MNPWVWLFVAPITEEVIFRAGLQETLLQRRLPPWAVIGVCALAFALAHVLLRGAGWTSWAVLLPALLLGYVYNRHRQLRWCVVGHALMNTLWFLTLQLGGFATMGLPSP
jgi:membrane protease YdiL (CAAX protease family)